jgi:hypothetical protein
MRINEPGVREHGKEGYARKPNLKRYMARVTGSAARRAYSGASTYGGGASGAERLSYVREEVRASPKKSSTGLVVRGMCATTGGETVVIEEEDIYSDEG